MFIVVFMSIISCLGTPHKIRIRSEQEKEFNVHWSKKTKRKNWGWTATKVDSALVPLYRKAKSTFPVDSVSNLFFVLPFDPFGLCIFNTLYSTTICSTWSYLFGLIYTKCPTILPHLEYIKTTFSFTNKIYNSISCINANVPTDWINAYYNTLYKWSSQN